MFAQSTLSRIVLTAAAGVLLTATAAGAAVADDNPTATTAGAAVTGDDPTGSQWRPHDHLYQGKVTSRVGLLIRSAPKRHSSTLGKLKHNQLVWIKCELKGENVRGNTYWYKLADGRWTWASARYIATLGRSPRMCR